ncbi:MAG TPA: hypothetical protein VG900_07295 [Hyphomicrobiaceae bacterium]|nr:hypothetical protein [Hyphomicrobiaceae bacterium]
MDDDAGSEELWPRVRRQAATLGRHAWLGLRRLAHEARPALRAFWSVAKPVLRSTGLFLLALLIVFEEWGWRPLAGLVARLARWRPWAQVEYAIARLPPYAALFVFILPTALLLPLKFLALFLIAKGQVMMAGALFIAAKIVATALVARLYILTQPALMQIGWFAVAHDRFMPWKTALTDRVHASWAWRIGRLWKERGKRLAVTQWRHLRPTALAAAAWAGVVARRLRIFAERAVRQLRQRWVAPR